jgi:FHA domain
VVFKDLGSTNGSFINRAQVREAVLQDGQMLHLGSVQMVYYSDATPPSRMAAPAPVGVLLTAPGEPPAIAPAVASFGGIAPVSLAGAPGVSPPPLPGQPATVALAGPAARAAAPPTAPPMPRRIGVRPGVAAPPPKTPAKKPNFGLGLLGALVGALVGSLIYFLVFRYTGLRLKLLAVGVGYLSGAGAELLGRKEGSKELGMIAAVLTLAGIIGAQYVVAHIWWKEANRGSGPSYAASVAEAKQVVQAVPTGSDPEIRAYLAKEAADDGVKPDLSAVTDEEIRDFRTNTLPSMQGLASGKVSREAFDQQHAPASQSKDEESSEGTFKAVFLLLLLSRLNLVSLVVAAGLAFKLCSNA